MSNDSKDSYMWAWLLFGFFLPLWIPVWAALYFDIAFKERDEGIFLLILSLFVYLACRRFSDTTIFKRVEKSFAKKLPNLFGGLVIFIPTLITSILAVLTSIFTYTLSEWAVMSLGIGLAIVGSILLILDTISSGE